MDILLIHGFETPCFTHWENTGLKGFADFQMLKHYIVEYEKKNHIHYFYFQSRWIASRFTLPLQTNKSSNRIHKIANVKMLGMRQ